MKPADRLSLAAILIALAPATILLFFGFLMIPTQLFLLTKEPLLWDGLLLIVVSDVCGVIGLVTLLFAVAKLFFLGDTKIGSPVVFLGGSLCGIAPLVFYGARSSPISIQILWALPLLGAVYVLFRSRHLLRAGFASSSVVRHVVELVLVMFVAALAVSAVPQRWLSPDELAERQNAWSYLRPASYSYALHLSGNLPLAVLIPKKIVVEGKRVTSAAYELSPSDPLLSRPLEPAEISAWTLDRVFDELAKAQREHARVRAIFSTRRGYVERALVEYDDSDRSWSMSVTDFEARAVKR